MTPTQPSLNLRRPKRESGVYGRPMTFEVAPDGTRALRVTDKCFAFVDLESGAELWTLDRASNAHHGCASFARDGETVALGELSTTIVVDAHTGKRHSTIKGSIYGAHAVAFSPDGSTVAIADFNDVPLRIHSRDGRLLRTFGHGAYQTDHGDEHCPVGGGDRSFDVHCVAFSPRGDCLASGGQDGSVRIWDVRPGLVRERAVGYHPRAREVEQPLHALMTTPMKDVRAVAFSIDGALAAAGDDGVVRVWDLVAIDGLSKALAEKSDAPALTFVGKGSVAFSPDGRFVAAIDDGERLVRVHDRRTGLEVAALESPHPVMFPKLLQVRFLADGRAAALDTNGSIAIWPTIAS